MHPRYIPHPSRGLHQPQVETQYRQDLESSTPTEQELALLLQAAAFSGDSRAPDNPRSFDPEEQIAPLYIRQAIIILRDPAHRSRLVSMIAN